MPVVTFAVSGRDNCAMVGGQPFVYARTASGSFVMRARCPHRGGPLNLATAGCDAGRLVCPWHGREASVPRLRRQIPAVRSGDRVTAVFPDTPGGSVSTEHRPLSAALTV